MVYLLINALGSDEEAMLDIAQRLGLEKYGLHYVHPSLSGTDRPAAQVVGQLGKTKVFIDGFQYIATTFEYNLALYIYNHSFRHDFFETKQIELITELGGKINGSQYAVAICSNTHGLNNQVFSA